MWSYVASIVVHIVEEASGGLNAAEETKLEIHFKTRVSMHEASVLWFYVLLFVRTAVKDLVRLNERRGVSNMINQPISEALQHQSLHEASIVYPCVVLFVGTAAKFFRG